MLQTGSKKGRSPNAPPCGQRCTEWNEEQEEFARHGAYILHKELFKTNHFKDVNKNELLLKLRPCKGAEYRERLGDTVQRKDVRSRQWRFVEYDGIVFSDHKEKTIRQSSTVLVIQTANRIVVSDTQAKVHIKELGAYLWIHLVKDSPSVYHWEDYAMNLVILIRGRQEKLPDYQKVRE